MTDYKIVSLVGPSGVGKTTIIKQLFARYPQLRMIPSLTTREQRPSDFPGDYIYVSPAEFARAKAAGELMWDIGGHGALYGTQRSAMETALAGEAPSFIILFPDLVRFLFDRYPEHYLPFFIEPLPEATLRQRMVDRGDPAETVQRRLDDCRLWSQEAHASGLPYRFVHNDGPIEETVTRIARMIGLEG